MLLVLLAVAMSAEDPAPPAPSVPPPPRASVITSVDWARRPSPDQLTALYPPKAWADGVAGKATLSCSVLATGAMTGCSVVGETPPGQGFGEAALLAAEFYRLKPMQPGQTPVEGGTIRIPVKFPPPPMTFDDAVSCYGQLHWHNVQVPGDELTTPREGRALAFARERAKATGVSGRLARERLEAARKTPPADDHTPFSRCWDML